MIKSFKRNFSIVLVASLVLTSANLKVEAKETLYTDNISLNANASVDENSIDLNWNVENPTQPFDFKVMKKKHNESDYSSLGIGENKESITVLNIYPEYRSSNLIPIDEPYVTWDEEYVENLPQSAKLKKWIEEPNSESSTGYGKGKIEVIPIAISDFRDSIDMSLYKVNDKYYTNHKGKETVVNVIMIGSWDSTGLDPKERPSESMLLRIEEYIIDGGSIIFGHDLFAPVGATNSWLHFSKYAGVTKQVPEMENGKVLAVGGDEIRIVKKASFLEYPWKINSSNLKIPITHTNRNMVDKENVYIEFSNPSDGFVTGGGEDWSTERLIEYEGKTNNFYLAVTNNVATVQTGHSLGKATSDEQKILANILFYMTQVSSTEGTNFKDTLGQDITSPTKPNITDIVIDTSNNKIKFKGIESEDIGTEYSYYIEGTGKNDGVIVNSNTATVNMQQGLKGYSYIIDDNPNGVPDNEIDINSINNTIEHNFSEGEIKQYYLHIKAIDNAGNFSETTHIRLSSLEHEVAINNVNIAESNPTSINLKLARDAVNNLPESFIKEELQRRLNNIKNISDSVFEKHNATSNLDVYIKSENMLSLSLSNNTISFNDFNGSEDLQQDGALELSINSSLPYEVNAYLEEEIQNADKSEIMDKSILNLKESSDSEYKEFIDVKTRLNLVPHGDAGNDKLHSFDFKLNGGIAHKKDVYKATIKFEVKQK